MLERIRFGGAVLNGPGAYTETIMLLNGLQVRLSVPPNNEGDDDTVQEYIVVANAEGASTQVVTVDGTAHRVVVVNDAPLKGPSLTVQIGAITITLMPQELFNEAYAPFSTYTVTASAAFRSYALRLVTIE